MRLWILKCWKPYNFFFNFKFSFSFRNFQWYAYLIFNRLLSGMDRIDSTVDTFCNWFQHVFHTAPYWHVLLLCESIDHLTYVTYTKCNISLPWNLYPTKGIFFHKWYENVGWNMWMGNCLTIAACEHLNFFLTEHNDNLQVLQYCMKIPGSSLQLKLIIFFWTKPTNNNFQTWKILIKRWIFIIFFLPTTHPLKTLFI